MVSNRIQSYYGRAYIAAVIAAGFATFSLCLAAVIRHPISGYQWFVLAALTLVSGSATVKLPGIYASITVSEIFVFTAVLLYGPAPGALIVALDALVLSVRLAKRHHEITRVLFNISAPIISLYTSAKLFFLLARVPPLGEQAAALELILAPLVVFAVAYFALNSWLIAMVLAFERKVSLFSVWPSNFVWLSLNYFCGASVAVLLVVYNRQVDFIYVGLIIPLLLLLYYTFRTSWGRVEDANKHLSELNSLYLSTIETLAMAIDAKDQITHGHIRRVQSYAMGLANRIGIKDDNLLKAIEAAALLHDMGKLAVPEYILNKPGKLTAAEFEKMKLHATVGADILSAINFPYPVVPIVRHHHENWDGTGYPVGLRGTDIPIGARILSVVDCFDALTSDRPYRPRLSDDEALSILKQRRGNMYDPLVVDMFAQVHQEIAPRSEYSGPSRSALNEITIATHQAALARTSPRLDDIAASSEEMLTLYELARAVADQADVSDIGDAIAKHLRRLIPSSLCVFYVYDVNLDEIEAKYAVGEGMDVVKGTRIRLGERLSGWVAANRQTILNSDPMLDFGEVVRSMTPRLRNCLSTPMLVNDTLFGVLSLYSSTADGFSEDHRRVIEVVARQIAGTVKAAAGFDRPVRRDNVTGLPTTMQFDAVFRRGLLSPRERTSETSVLLIDIVKMKEVNAIHGRAAGDEVLRQVATRITSTLRAADLLFRHAGDDFVAVLMETDARTAHAIGERISQSISREPVTVSKDGRSIRVDVAVVCSSAPNDDASPSELVNSSVADRLTVRPPSSIH